MLPVLFATVDLVPAPGPDTKKISNKESPVQGDEVIFPRELSKCICYLLLQNNLLPNYHKGSEQHIFITP